MPSFYFHLHNDMDVTDEEGREFPDLEAALAHASGQVRALAGQVLKDSGCIVLSHRIDVESAEGVVLGSVRIRDAIRVED